MLKIGDRVVFDYMGGGKVSPVELRTRLGAMEFLLWIRYHGEIAEIVHIATSMEVYDIEFVDDGMRISGVDKIHFADLPADYEPLTLAVSDLFKDVAIDILTVHHREIILDDIKELDTILSDGFQGFASMTGCVLYTALIENDLLEEYNERTEERC